MSITEKEFQLIPVTQVVRDFVAESGVQNGVVFVITSHTTTGITVNENLDCLYADIEETLERLDSHKLSICPCSLSSQLWGYSKAAMLRDI
ncbi:MAG: YjbQ family protein [Enterocloster sp.]